MCSIASILEQNVHLGTVCVPMILQPPDAAFECICCFMVAGSTIRLKAIKVGFFKMIRQTHLGLMPLAACHGWWCHLIKVDRSVKRVTLKPYSTSSAEDTLHWKRPWGIRNWNLARLVKVLRGEPITTWVIEGLTTESSSISSFYLYTSMGC